MTRETAAINAVRAESEATERLVPPPQNPYWDLDLLTPDDVCALLKVKRYPEALEQFDQAIAGNPDEGEFYAFRGYAKFLLSTQSSDGFREAQKDFQRAVKLSERAAPTHYLMGEVARIRGDRAGAIKHYNRALELRPDYVDAKRQLRFLSSKRDAGRWS